MALIRGRKSIRRELDDKLDLWLIDGFFACRDETQGPPRS
jgi:hypothetical protein